MDEKLVQLAPPLTTVKALLQHGATTATNDKITFSVDAAKAIQLAVPHFISFLSTIAMDRQQTSNTKNKVQRKTPNSVDFYEAIDDTDIVYLRGQVALRTQALKRARWIQDARKKASEPKKVEKKKSTSDKTVDFTKLNTGDDSDDSEDVEEEEEEEEESDGDDSN